MLERPLDPTVVIDRVAEWYHIDRAEMVGDSRAVHVVKARWCAAAILHEYSGRGWPSVASLLGRVHHGGSAGLMNAAKRFGTEELTAVVTFVKEAS